MAENIGQTKGANTVKFLKPLMASFSKYFCINSLAKSQVLFVLGFVSWCVFAMFSSHVRGSRRSEAVWPADADC